MVIINGVIIKNKINCTKIMKSMKIMKIKITKIIKKIEMIWTIIVRLKIQHQKLKHNGNNFHKIIEGSKEAANDNRNNKKMIIHKIKTIVIKNETIRLIKMLINKK